MRFVKALVLAGVVLLIGSGVALAGDRLMVRSQDRDRTPAAGKTCMPTPRATCDGVPDQLRARDRAQDGSGADAADPAVCDQTRQQDREREQVREQQTRASCDGDQAQTRTRERDGEQVQAQTGTNAQARTQSQTRTQADGAGDGDGACVGGGSGKEGTGYGRGSD
jgi:hypothetical protein